MSARPCTSSIVMLAVSGREVMVMLLVLRRGIAVAVGVGAPRRKSDAKGYGIDKGRMRCLAAAFVDPGTRDATCALSRIHCGGCGRNDNRAPRGGALRPCLGVPVNEGDIVDDFELLDQHGQSVTLNDLVEAGFQWSCSSTRRPQAPVEPWRAAISAIGSEFAELGASRVGISADPVDRQKKFDDRTALASRC